MNVAQSLAAAPPIEQVITRVHVGGGQTDPLPGLDAGAQFGAVQELPVGEDELSIRSKMFSHEFNQWNAQLARGNVMECRETGDHIESRRSKVGIRRP
jgi:hypothetical protein